MLRDDLLTPISESFKTFKTFARGTFIAPDFMIGVACGLGAVAVSFVWPNMRHAPAEALTNASIALGIAVLAVALTALALVAGLFTDTFRVILERSHATGLKAALVPFQTVAAVSTCTALLGLLALIIGPETSGVARSIGLGAIVLFDVWSLAGTIQLVNLTVYLGLERTRHLSDIESTRRHLQDAKKKTG